MSATGEGGRGIEGAVVGRGRSWWEGGVRGGGRGEVEEAMAGRGRPHRDRGVEVGDSARHRRESFFFKTIDLGRLYNRTACIKARGKTNFLP